MSRTATSARLAPLALNSGAALASFGAALEGGRALRHVMMLGQFCGDAPHCSACFTAPALALLAGVLLYLACSRATAVAKSA